MKNYFACSADAVNVSGVPKEIKILPLGHVHSTKGDFLVDDESVGLIRKFFRRRNLDLVIDYEHQTLKDIQAPAGGWIKDIYKGEDAIMAKVEWTSKAEEYLKNKEYKYLSPVVLVRKRDGKAAGITSAALTNTPAIDGMFAIVNSADIDDLLEDDKEEMIMDLKEIAKLLGLPEETPEEEIKKALTKAGSTDSRETNSQKTDDANPGNADPVVQEANKAGNAANSTVLSLLGLKNDAKTEDVAAAIMALRASNDNSAEILALKQELEERNADDLVERALKEGKITAALKDWAREYALSDKKGFESYLEKAPVAVPMKKLELSDAPGKTEDVNAVILKNCGQTAEEIEKYYKED